VRRRVRNGQQERAAVSDPGSNRITGGQQSGGSAKAPSAPRLGCDSGHSFPRPQGAASGQGAHTAGRALRGHGWNNPGEPCRARDTFAAAISSRGRSQRDDSASHRSWRGAANRRRARRRRMARRARHHWRRRHNSHCLQVRTGARSCGAPAQSPRWRAAVASCADFFAPRRTRRVIDAIRL